MWIPDIALQPSRPWVALIVALHAVVILAIAQLPTLFWGLLPLLVLSCGVNVSKYGLLRLKRSIVQVRLTPSGWFVRCRNGTEQGPYRLTAGSHLGAWVIRISLRHEAGQERHVLLTRGMVGEDVFRKLQVFLRWAPDKQQAPITE